MWPRSANQAILWQKADAYTSSEVDDKRLLGEDEIKLNSGRVGLDNLANTYYLNSSLQGLTHTLHLTDYFLENTICNILTRLESLVFRVN